MRDLLKSVYENYNINVNTIEKFGVTTINDIYLIDDNKEKYIIKVYNVDDEQQIEMSARVQKDIYELSKNTADVLINKNNKLYTKFNEKNYIIQEYIEKQECNMLDKVDEIARELFFLHRVMKKFNENAFINKVENKDYTMIKNSIEKSRDILKQIKIEKKIKKIFENLLNERKNLLEKYEIRIFP